MTYYDFSGYADDQGRPRLTAEQDAKLQELIKRNAEGQLTPNERDEFAMLTGIIPFPEKK